MRHPSTLTLHRLRYGELDAGAIRELEAHLDRCATCRERLRAQRADRAAFELAPLPPAIRAAASAPPSPAWRWARVLVPAASLAAALSLLPVPEEPGPALPDPAPEAGRTKGAGADLEAWLEDGDGARPLGAGDTVRAGDRVQLRYRAGGGWVSFAGVDGSGAVELYEAVQVTGRGWRAAPFSLTLDDSPGDQDFCALFTAARPEAREIAEAVESGETPEGMTITCVTLTKAR